MTQTTDCVRGRNIGVEYREAEESVQKWVVSRETGGSGSFIGWWSASEGRNSLPPGASQRTQGVCGQKEARAEDSLTPPDALGPTATRPIPLYPK